MEELTTKMHKELKINDATDVMHRCFCALEDHLQWNDSIEVVTKRYNVTKQQIEEHQNEYELLAK